MMRMCIHTYRQTDIDVYSPASGSFEPFLVNMVNTATNDEKKIQSKRISKS